MKEVPVKVKVLNPLVKENNYLPKYMTPHASGMDVFAVIEDVLTIHPGEIALIPTGIAVAIPPGYEIQVRPRSGLAVKYGITLPNTPGTIDADFRGEIKVIIMNLGENDFTIKPGDRIAQMVLTPVYKIKWEEVEELPDTDRGEGGFGHTGI